MVLAVCAVVAMMPFPVSEPRQSEPARLCRWTSGLSTLIKDHLAGGASRLAALLLPQILPVFSVVAPCHPGAALRDLVLVQRGPATRRLVDEFGLNSMPGEGMLITMRKWAR